MKITRGGSWFFPRARELHSIAYENSNEVREFAWDMGIRCVMIPDDL
jgi:hypothetical protein